MTFALIGTPEMEGSHVIVPEFSHEIPLILLPQKMTGAF